DQLGQRRAENPRQADDGRIVEQVEQEGFDRFGTIRTAQIGQDDRHAPVGPFLQLRGGLAHWAPIRFRTCSTWAIGTSGRMPWPRLKIHGPWPQASIS